LSEVAFITGAGAGFGRALAESFACDGTAVVLADIDRHAAEAAAESIAASGGTALAVECDVANMSAVEAAVARGLAVFGGIDILINNAALHLSTYSLPYSELGLTRIQNCVQVNVMGIVHCTLGVRATMAARGKGRIVNLSSSAGYEPRSIYGVTKLAVRGLTTSFAAELATEGIRVNAVAPGLMGTEAAVADLEPELFDRYAHKLQLVKRRGEMSDVVAAIRFLCSDDASFITGETLRITGGYPLQA
jgi:3-oxoacyl-[acyl-carrier protein] reductase